MRSPVDALAQKLRTIGSLSDDDLALLRLVPLKLTSIARGRDAVTESEPARFCCLLVDGYLCRYKMSEDGSRQILSFHNPGDIPDLQSLHLWRNDHSLLALTPCTVAYISHDALWQTVRQSHTLTALLWRETLIESAKFRQWMLELGQYPAEQRLAHLFCEIYAQAYSVGLAEGHSCPLPVTQQDLADALGLSAVHINRTLMTLRSAGHADFRDGRLKINDWRALVQAAEFNPAYLHRHLETLPPL